MTVVAAVLLASWTGAAEVEAVVVDDDVVDVVDVESVVGVVDVVNAEVVVVVVEVVEEPSVH